MSKLFFKNGFIFLGHFIFVSNLNKLLFKSNFGVSIFGANQNLNLYIYILLFFKFDILNTMKQNG